MITGRHSGQDFDALADLFLLDEPRGPVAADVPAPTADGRREPGTMQVLALALGHLPTISGPWAAQFASALAAEDGAPVGLVRLSGGTIQVELFRGAAAQESLTLESTLESALAALASQAATVLVRVDEMDEPLLLDAADLDGAVILSGVDDASLVGAYRLIKRLVVDRGEREPLPLRAGFVGAGRDAAANALGRLARASIAHAGVGVAPACTVERMGAARSTLLHRGRAPERLEDLLAMLRSPTATERPIAPETREPQTIAAATAPIERSRDDRTWPAWSDLLEPEPAAVCAPPPERSFDGLTASNADARTLLGGVPGVAVLPLDCPCAPGVAIGVDGRGAIQVAAGDRDAGMLLAAASWAREHAAWIVAASGGRAGDAAVVLRLFTERPASWRGLLGGEVRVHLLDRQSPVSARALNEPCAAPSGA